MRVIEHGFNIFYFIIMFVSFSTIICLEPVIIVERKVCEVKGSYAVSIHVPSYTHPNLPRPCFGFSKPQKSLISRFCVPIRACLHNLLSLIQRVTNHGLPGNVPVFSIEVLHPPKPFSPRQNGKVGHPTTLLHEAPHGCWIESEVGREREPDGDSPLISPSLAL